MQSETAVGLTAYTPGSAPGPMLGNEYGKRFTFLVQQQGSVRMDIFRYVVVISPGVIALSDEGVTNERRGAVNVD